LILGLTTFDSYSSAGTTTFSIADEFNNNAATLTYTGKIEEFKTTTNLALKDSVYLVSYRYEDTLRNFQFDNLKQILEFNNKNVKTLDSLIPKLYFNRNKEIFKVLNNHYRNNSIYLTNEKKLLKITRYYDPINKLILGYTNTYKVDKELTIYADKFISARDELEHSNETSKLPLNAINYLASPLYLIADKYFKDTGKTVEIILK
jgi:hypothetical protein